MKALVFLGPTMPVADARALLPDAIFLPPARQADVLSAVETHRPDVIALIDGVFHQSLSVWHKEILYALSTGVHVYGSSSMGALRAAECHPFGMVGVGEVFRAYRDGELTDDDEVALAHADAESDFRPLSVPMVNVRATLRAAVEATVIDASTEAQLIVATKARYFPERTWPDLLDDAGAVLAPDDVAALRSFVREHAVDQKRLDAEELLRLIADLPDAPAPFEPTFELNRSHVFEALTERDRRVQRAPGEVSFEEISRYAVLHDPTAQEAMERGVDRELLAVLADLLHVDVDDDAVADEGTRFRVRHRLTNDDDFDRYLVRNDLDTADFDELMRTDARARRLRAWLTVRRYKLGLVQPLLGELRRRDTYGEWADAAAAHETVLTAAYSRAQHLEVEESEVPTLLRDHARATGWRPDTDLFTWAEESGFAQTYDVLIELKRSRLADEVLSPEPASGSSIDGATG